MNVPSRMGNQAVCWSVVLTLIASLGLLPKGSFAEAPLESAVHDASVNGRRATAMVTVPDDESVTPGMLDLQFDPGTGANGTVFALLPQEGNELLMGGSFTMVNGIARHGIARLGNDGKVDAGFSADVLSGETIYAIARQPDGKLIIGGTFTSIGGVARNRIARLLSDGRLDSSFNAEPGADDVIKTLALQPDGKVLVGGLFLHFGDSVRSRLARLQADGSLDPTFNPGADGPVTCLVLQSDGRILVGGSFRGVNGVTRVYAARLGPDGAVDPTFNPGGGSTVVNGTGIKAMALQEDGKLVIGGDSSILYGSGRIALNRLLENGDLDRTFNPNVPSGSSVLAIAIQSDGQLLIGGDFSRLAGPACCALYDRKGIARLNRDGSVDTSFDVGAGVDPIYVTALKLQPDFKVVLGGAFTSYNGYARPGTARLQGDVPTRIADWSYNGAMQLTVMTQPGKIYVLEATTNLINWTPVATNTASSVYSQFQDPTSAPTGARLYRVQQVAQ